MRGDGCVWGLVLTSRRGNWSAGQIVLSIFVGQSLARCSGRDILLPDFLVAWAVFISLSQMKRSYLESPEQISLTALVRFLVLHAFDLCFYFAVYNAVNDPSGLVASLACVAGGMWAFRCPAFVPIGSQSSWKGPGGIPRWNSRFSFFLSDYPTFRYSCETVACARSRDLLDVWYICIFCEKGWSNVHSVRKWVISRSGMEKV